MKTIEELEIFLIEEIKRNKSSIENHLGEKYYNKISGDISPLLTSILFEHLLYRKDWDKNKWLDDSLLTKIKYSGNSISIWGVTIWGKEGTSSQWTSPFYFKAIMNTSNSFKEYSFLFGDEEEVSYEDYKKNRSVWDSDFYSDKRWDPSERNWTYIIHKSNSVL